MFSLLRIILFVYAALAPELRDWRRNETIFIFLLWKHLECFSDLIDEHRQRVACVQRVLIASKVIWAKSMASPSSLAAEELFLALAHGKPYSQRLRITCVQVLYRTSPRERPTEIIYRQFSLLRVWRSVLHVDDVIITRGQCGSCECRVSLWRPKFPFYSILPEKRNLA